MIRPSLLVLLISVSVPSIAWADIPPPPPTVPGTNMAVPSPLASGIAGLMLSAAAITVGVLLVRKRSLAARAAAAMVALVALGLTGAIVAWSNAEHSRYREQRNNWRSNGPVLERPPVAVDGKSSNQEQLP